MCGLGIGVSAPADAAQTSETRTTQASSGAVRRTRVIGIGSTCKTRVRVCVLPEGTVRGKDAGWTTDLDQSPLAVPRKARYLAVTSRGSQARERRRVAVCPAVVG